VLMWPWLFSDKTRSDSFFDVILFFGVGMQPSRCYFSSDRQSVVLTTLLWAVVPLGRGGTHGDALPWQVDPTVG